jgi:hypothetical protein
MIYWTLDSYLGTDLVNPGPLHSEFKLERLNLDLASFIFDKPTRCEGSLYGVVF